jgi:hypothetical protein
LRIIGVSAPQLGRRRDNARLKVDELQLHSFGGVAVDAAVRRPLPVSLKEGNGEA